MTSFVLVTALVGIIISIVYWSWRNGISPMPSSAKAKRCLLLMVPKDVKGKIYELGSGWGTLVFPLARAFPQCTVVGYETSPIPYLCTKIYQWIFRVPNVCLKRQDFFAVSLEDAAVVVCYLYPGAMRQLKDKLLSELKPGALVVSNTFAIPGWKPEAVAEIGDMYHTKIYVYRLYSKKL